MARVKIRQYKSSDLDRLYRIDNEAFSPDIAYSYPELQHYVQSKRCRTLVAEEGDEIVGFVIGCSEERKLGHIITIDVMPHMQRHRIGTRLLGRIESWLWNNGAEAIYLETAVDDAGAFGFYDKNSYFILERIAGYYNGSLDAFLMMKTSKR